MCSSDLGDEGGQGGGLEDGGHGISEGMDLIGAIFRVASGVNPTQDLGQTRVADRDWTPKLGAGREPDSSSLVTPPD